MSGHSRGSTVERLSVVETHVDQILEDGLRREEKQGEILDKVTELAEALGEIKSDMARQKGFMGGIVWVVAALCTAIYNLAGPIYNWIVKHTGTG